MSGFRVRIELQGASQGDYALLQRRMEAAGYHRLDMAAAAVDGRRPSFAIAVPVYAFEASIEADDVRAHAKRIADTVTRGGLCHVTPMERASLAAAG